MRSFTKSLLSVLALALIPASPALAELESSPMMNEGKQVGCQLTFAQSQPDPANFGKGNSLAEGSVNFLKFDKNLIFALKIGVTGDGQPKRVGPAEAFFLDGDKPNSSSLMSKLESDDKGYRLFAFKVDDPTIAAVITRTGQDRVVRMSYRLRADGPETQVAIPLSVETDRMAFVGWLDCIGKMTE